MDRIRRASQWWKSVQEQREQNAKNAQNRAYVNPKCLSSPPYFPQTNSKPSQASPIADREKTSSKSEMDEPSPLPQSSPETVESEVKTLPKTDEELTPPETTVENGGGTTTLPSTTPDPTQGVVWNTDVPFVFEEYCCPAGPSDSSLQTSSLARVSMDKAAPAIPRTNSWDVLEHEGSSGSDSDGFYHVNTIPL